MLVLSNFFFCHYVFKKSAAAEASESVYMRERVNTSMLTLSDEQMHLKKTMFGNIVGEKEQSLMKNSFYFCPNVFNSIT